MLPLQGGGGGSPEVCSLSPLRKDHPRVTASFPEHFQKQGSQACTPKVVPLGFGILLTEP